MQGLIPSAAASELCLDALVGALQDDVKRRLSATELVDAIEQGLVLRDNVLG
jgi:hypothetical protein